MSQQIIRICWMQFHHLQIEHLNRIF
jgi:hypothetical protein